LSNSSWAVGGATSGSGVQSSTNSSISYSSISTCVIYHDHTTYRIRKLHLLLRAVLGRKQIPHSEQKQKQLNCASHGIVLIARLDVAHGDGGTGDALELRVCVSEETRSRVLYFV
jgi:hypothetical protein